MYPALFLDRDGVIIENRDHYVRSWTDVVFYPTALRALAKIRLSPYKIVIVTNQSAVGRGIIPLDTAEQLNLRVQKVVEEAGGRIDAVFMCPHAPRDGCSCRKPRPGLLLKAAERLSLDLEHSIMIGDAISDMTAGHAASIQKLIMLLTGRGTAQLQLPRAAPFAFHFDVFDSLSDAIQNLPELQAQPLD